MDANLYGNNSPPDISDHQLSDIIEIITPELDGATVALKPHLRVVVQPTQKTVRFRYKCEGRTAGTIPGENSTKDTKTFPTVEIVNYSGEARVLVSCVTKDEPYRQHPHQLVGRNCKNGVLQKDVGPGEPLRVELSNVGIQCVTRNGIVTSLQERSKKNIDPFKTGFDHINDTNSIELNALRLCFQAFLKTSTGLKALRPIVTEPLYDRKAKNDLVISELCSCAATVDGGDRLILLCEKVNKDDIKVRFKALDNDHEVWHAYADFEPSNVHKQTAIAFRTPRYPQHDLPKHVKTYVELECPSSGKRSEALEFEFHDPGMLTFVHLRRKLKRRQDLDIFQHILSVDSETTATRLSCPPTDIEGELDDNETVSTERTESTASKQHSLDTLNESESAARRKTESTTEDGEMDNDLEHGNDMEIELEVPQINYPALDECTQTSTPMDEILRHPTLMEPLRALSATDKITEWMRSSEFERTDSLTVENGDSTSLSPVTVCTNITSNSANNHTTISTATDEDKTFTDLMEQVAELDDLYLESQSRRDTLDNPIIRELSLGGLSIGEAKSTETLVEVGDTNLTLSIAKTGPSFVGIDVDAISNTASAQPSVDVDESFDETATYTSLKFAFKNPVQMPVTEKSSSVFVNKEDGLVVLKNPPAPKIRVNRAQTPPSPPLPLPPRTPSPVTDQRLPPLPPKRKASQELGSSSATSRSSVDISRASSFSSRPPSQIIIMRTPEQSPTKRQVTPTSSPKKRQGFFSRLFSRRKSKAELAVEEKRGTNKASSLANSNKGTSPIGSREPSIGHFSLGDANRSSMRSIKSLQGTNSGGLSPNNTANCLKNGKPVARSSSSVSGKRPAHLNADVIHIPLKGESAKSLPQQEGKAFTFGQYLDRKTLSALQLADIPVCDGNMELVAIADRQSIRNLCEGEFGVILDPSVDLQEAEHFALYTSVPPERQVTANSSEDNLKCYEDLDEAPILTADEIARRLAEANGLQ